MPTENRSSNTEMVSVPRVPTREMLNGVCMHPDLARSLWAALLKNAPQPAEQHQGEPVALPSCKLVSKYNSHDWDEGYRDGWGACLDEIAKLGPLYTRPAPADPGEVESTPECFCVEHGLHIEALRAQLAERDALLHEVSISPDWSLSVDLQVRISNALSASAEPSAPIERDEQAAFKAHFADYLAGANKLGTRYNNMVARGIEIGWMARAGVPGKPSQP